MEAIEKLKAVLCDAEGYFCCAGSYGDKDVIAQALTELQWRPIETAPMDGETAVLGFQKTLGGLWVIAPMYFKDGAWLLLAFHTESTEFEMHPTHWMRLPAPPSNGKDHS